MNVLFLTLLDFDSIEEKNIYTDLLREFRNKGHNVYIVSPIEKRKKKHTFIIKKFGTTILKLKIGNMQKTNVIEKGISTLCIEHILLTGIRKYFSNVKFDLVIYCTPPITFCSAIGFIKKRDNAKTYLLLKDIFPQNAVDIEMLKKTGLKSLIYKYFRKKEKELYALSDRIGCMSKANVEYVIKHNPEVVREKVEICPNSIEVFDMSVDAETRTKIRNKYGIPVDKQVFVYGGNLGKPQGVDFMIECLKRQEKNTGAYFLIVGDGTEFAKIESYLKYNNPSNIKLIKRLPKNDYDRLVGACDVGMIFLDHRFTIPNFPSRILSYMQAKIPILAATDSNTDIGKVIVEGGFGWWCESNNVESYSACINVIMEANKIDMGIKGFNYLQQYYSSYTSYKIITGE